MPAARPRRRLRGARPGSLARSRPCPFRPHGRNLDMCRAGPVTGRWSRSSCRGGRSPDARPSPACPAARPDGPGRRRRPCDVRRDAGRRNGRRGACPGGTRPAGPVLTEPPTDTWRAQGVLLGVAGDLAVLDDKKRGVEALDMATGQLVWRVPEAGSCRLVALDAPQRPGHWSPRARHGPAWCAGGHRSARPRRHGCRVPPPCDRFPARGDVARRERRVVVDRGGHVLLVAARPSGWLRATRLDTETGRQVWTYASPHPVVTPGGTFTARGQDAAS